MRHKFITLLLLPLLLAGCSKDYFDELRHPLEIQGSFDPMYGIPLAKMSANMATLVGMADTNSAISVYVGDQGIVSLHYDYNEHTVLSWVAEKGKGAKDGSKSDTLYNYTIINGKEDIDIFKKLLFCILVDYHSLSYFVLLPFAFSTGYFLRFSSSFFITISSSLTSSLSAKRIL
jgi:hypothetical protein